MESNISTGPRNTAGASAKTYSAPELQFFGFIADLTLGRGSLIDDGCGSTNGNASATGSNINNPCG